MTATVQGCSGAEPEVVPGIPGQTQPGARPQQTPVGVALHELVAMRVQGLLRDFGRPA